MFPLWLNVYDNFGGSSDSHTNNPFIPEIWANESLAILEENMVGANLVHRDFEAEFARFGDVVHTRRPGEFVSKRKTPSDSVTVQDVTATSVLVPLNQHIHVSFLIKDGEESKSFKDLVEVYMAPAMLAQARIIDRLVLGQYPAFLTNAYGGLGTLTTSNARDRVLGTRNLLNINKAYMANRQMILSPATETTFLNLDIFTQAQQVGDSGEALKEAWLGRKYGFNMYMDQNMSGVVTTGLSTLSGAINHSGGYGKGSTVLVVNSFTGAVAVGQWLTVVGDDTPQQVTAHTETLGNTTAITLYPGLRGPVANASVVTVTNNGTLVNLSGGYAAGWSKDILWDTGNTPQIGQLVSFNTEAGAAANVYTVVEVDTVASTILLDRPLVLGIANNDPINLGPPGQYNLAFHRNCMSLVVRPLALPRAGTGALSAVVNHNDLSMRATITYDGNRQGHLVTLDMLCGIAILDTNLGAVLLG